MRRREDARTIGRLVDSLDEECARIYVARFKAKWDLSGVRLSVGSRPAIRADELERSVYRELLLGIAHRPLGRRSAPRPSALVSAPRTELGA